MENAANSLTGKPTTPNRRRPEVERWENEGGPAIPLPRDAAAGTPLPSEPDRREQALMGEISVEGRPPSRRLLMTEWKWVISLGAAILIPAAIVALVMLDAPTLITGAAVLLLATIAASPVWGAALMRAREHRLAREQAGRIDSTPGRTAAGDPVIVVKPDRRRPVDDDADGDGPPRDAHAA